MTIERNAPAYYVTVVPEGGTAEEVDLTERVLSFAFDDDERKVDKLSLTVDNNDLAAFDDPVWSKGNLIRFSFGYDGLMSPVREAIIRKVTGGRTLTIEAHAKAVLMDTETKQRVFENTTRSEIVRQIAKENGYASTEALFIEETSEVYETVTQANYTDAQFLRKLAHLQGYEFFIDFDGFHWHPRRVNQQPILELVYFTDPGQGDILDFVVESNITRLPGKISFCSRDPRFKESICESADNESDKNRDATAPFIIVRDKRTGKLEKKPATASEVTVADNSESQGEAADKAKGNFRRGQQNAVKLSLQLVGNPTMLAKSVIHVRGMGKRLSGRYYVRSVRHTLGTNGYTMEAMVSTDGANAAFGDAGEEMSSSAAVQTQVDALKVALVKAPLFVNTSAVRALIAAAERFGADGTKANAQTCLNATRDVIGNASTVPAISGPTNELRALSARTLSTLSTAAIARLNKKEAKDKKDGDEELKPKIKRDPVTGALVTVYPDQGGREN